MALLANKQIRLTPQAYVALNVARKRLQEMRPSVAAEIEAANPVCYPEWPSGNPFPASAIIKSLIRQTTRPAGHRALG